MSEVCGFGFKRGCPWCWFRKWWNEPQFYTVECRSEREALELAAEVEQLWPGASVTLHAEKSGDVKSVTKRFQTASNAERPYSEAPEESR